ncbi:Uncharacterized conserved protein YciI, contains a putative active-site phosphohistidine [Actinopolyspora mzabensis]|uniref:Uncharacterized conserved protein YciI, contains a putative active-site phosphohistidine n=2 Tax=Actinopolyspora mzabensis TaxID=995066 RepID=A0A1G8VXQ8_ACTMZ|nr:Uncharacterized conserved protein YciI, contains a putative active-site phosphohistidine [Actinopolyspora mzabensis]
MLLASIVAGRYRERMYVVLVHYTAPLADVDALLQDHSEWLSHHQDSGDFVASGRRHPRNGGVIIARSMSRGQLDAILATDPFVVHKVARQEVIEFQALRTIPELADYADHLTTAD